jgi:hypothetical protein
MALPLPRVIADIQPGGGVNTALNGINALALNILKKKYYAPNIESEINNRNALTEGQKILNQFMPEKLQLANALSQLQNQYYAPNIQSEIANRNAITQRSQTMTPLEAEELRLRNEYYPQAKEAEINWRNMGGSNAGVGQKEIMQLQRQLGLENPDWDADKINQAASAYISGQSALPSGEPLPQPSGIVNSITSQIVKRGTTAPIITGNIKANQADAELTVLNDYAEKGLAPYGDTIMNYSPQQILDTFKSDPESQKRLGRFIASQALQYEAAQQRIKLANGQPGVTSTEGLMKLSGQMVESRFPSLSSSARKEATRFLDEALREGLKARQSVRVDAASLNSSPKSGINKKYDLSDLDIPEGYIGLYKDNKQYFFPPDLVDKKLSEGFTYD